MSKSANLFSVGDHVVYPAHGVGTVKGVETQEVAGLALDLYIITFDHEKMTLRVPTNKAKTAGLRGLADGAVVTASHDYAEGPRPGEAHHVVAPRSGVRSQNQFRGLDLHR